MCPLRIILVFLSATLAGFFLLRRIKSQPQLIQETEDRKEQQETAISTKVGSAISAGFWTCVDMASGRYLWRNLVSDKKC